MVVRQTQITNEEDPLRYPLRMEDEQQREPVVLQVDQPLPQDDAPMRPLEDLAPREVRAVEEPRQLPRQELRGRERSRERERKELEPLGYDVVRRGDVTMRTYRRDPNTIQDHAMPDQERIRRLGDEDHADDPARIWRRLADPEDVQMGMINYIELPRGEQLQTGVNLDYEEQQSLEAIDESEELWAPSDFPPELVKAGKEQELESMRSFEVYRLVPLASNYTGGTATCDSD
jgi:hypothetical protein